jgi:hypothetical protein
VVAVVLREAVLLVVALLVVVLRVVVLRATVLRVMARVLRAHHAPIPRSSW